MPAKKPKKPTKRVRYLLSADQRLRRLSLRKMSDGRKKAKSEPRSNPPQPNALPAEARHSTEPPRARWTSSRALGLAMVVVVSAAILIVAGLPDGTTAVDRAAASPPQLDAASTAPRSDSTMAPAATPSAVRNTSPTDRATRKSAAVERVKPPTAADARQSTSGASDETVVTLTGCVDLDGQTLTLKDVSGAGAPKSRSWRFGFRKRASTVDLIDVGNASSLRAHVGERVAATGTLEDRVLRARSFRVVSASCR